MGGRFSKARETFPARKTIFSSSVSKNGEVHTPEVSCVKGSSVHIKNMRKNSSVIVRFEILLWLCGPEKFPEISRNGSLERNTAQSFINFWKETEDQRQC